MPLRQAGRATGIFFNAAQEAQNLARRRFRVFQLNPMSDIVNEFHETQIVETILEVGAAVGLEIQCHITAPADEGCRLSDFLALQFRGIGAGLGMKGHEFKDGAALQGSAGNTIIRNTVSVSYSDALSIAQTPVTSTAVITVTTVNVAPTIKSVTPSPGTTGATGATQTFAVEIVTNSNGPGTINLAIAAPRLCGNWRLHSP